MKTETFADYRKSLDEAVKIFSAKIEGMSDEELTAYINSPGSASTVDRVLSLCSDSTVARVLSLCSDSTVARVLSLCSDSTVARVLSLCSDSTVDRVLSLCSDSTVARVLSLCSDSTVARVLSLCSDSTVARVLSLCSASTVARVLSLCSDSTVDRVLSLCSDSTVARVLSLCSDSTVDRVQTLINLEIPVVENIDQKILEAITAEGCSLNMGAWHTCKTTHCRAGWAIHLAGKEGYALEKKLGDSEMAGRMIYTVSRPGVPYPDFYAPTEVALEDIKKCAAEATAG